MSKETTKFVDDKGNTHELGTESGEFVRLDDLSAEEIASIQKDDGDRVLKTMGILNQ